MSAAILPGSVFDLGPTSLRGTAWVDCPDGHPHIHTSLPTVAVQAIGCTGVVVRVESASDTVWQVALIAAFTRCHFLPSAPPRGCGSCTTYATYGHTYVPTFAAFCPPPRGCSVCTTYAACGHTYFAAFGPGKAVASALLAVFSPQGLLSLRHPLQPP